MRAPSTFMLAALALSVSRALAADVAAPAAVITDSDGNPVTNSAGECWRSSGIRSGLGADCRRSGPGAAATAQPVVPPASASSGSSQPALSSGASASESGNAAGAASSGLVDSSGQPVRGSFGECWGTGFSKGTNCPQAVAGGAAVAAANPAPAGAGTGSLQSGSTSSAGTSENFASETTRAGLVDSNGQPVRSSFGECWGTGFSKGANCPQTVAAAGAAGSAAASTTASADKMQPDSSGAGGAGNTAGNVAAAGLVDSNGQPVRSGFGECWGTSFSGPNPANCVAASGTQAAAVAPSSTSSGTAVAAAAPAAVAAGAAASTASVPGPAMAKGNPGYLTDSNGYVVRSGAGDCWHTGSWTPALANVVGCDGVLARAAPVPAPAPSPKPQPPEESATQAPNTAQPSAALPEPPSVPVTPVPGESAETPPAAIAPPEATPPAAVAPSESGSEAPAVVPPSPPPAAQAEVAPQATEPSPPPSAAARQPQSEKVTLDTDTYFDFDKSTLKPEGERRLKELASRLAAMKLEVVVATGHTDWTGTDAYNQKLSERRAQAVKRFLTEQGLPGDRIFTEGKGEKQPIASNRTREGRAKNRRVEVELVGTRSR